MSRHPVDEFGSWLRDHRLAGDDLTYIDEQEEFLRARGIMPNADTLSRSDLFLIPLGSPRDGIVVHVASADAAASIQREGLRGIADYRRLSYTKWATGKVQNGFNFGYALDDDAERLARFLLVETGQGYGTNLLVFRARFQEVLHRTSREREAIFHGAHVDPGSMIEIAPCRPEARGVPRLEDKRWAIPGETDGLCLARALEAATSMLEMEPEPEPEFSATP